MRLFFRLRAWPRLGGQVFIEGFLGCEPVAAEFAAFDQSVGQKMADMTSRIAGIIRRLLDRDPFWQ